MTCLACHLACHGIDLQCAVVLLGGRTTGHQIGAALQDVVRIPGFEPAQHCGVAVEMVEVLEQLETVVMSPISALIGIGRQGNCSFKAFIDPILIGSRLPYNTREKRPPELSYR